MSIDYVPEYVDDTNRGPAHDVALREYQASRARHIRSVTMGVEQRLRQTVGKRRGPLMEEISNLTLLAHDRFATYQAALKAYEAKAPSRVTPSGLLKPSPTERMIRGVDKLYRDAVKAAELFRGSRRHHQEAPHPTRGYRRQNARTSRRIRTLVDQPAGNDQWARGRVHARSASRSCARAHGCGAGAPDGDYRLALTPRRRLIRSSRRGGRRSIGRLLRLCRRR